MNKNIIVTLIVLTLALVSTIALAGDVRGPRVDTNSLAPGYYRTYTFVFQAGVPAWVGVKGDGGSDIDCWLADQNNGVVDSDTDDTSTCLLEVTPRWTGTFTLKVQNVGSQFTVYGMETN